MSPSSPIWPTFFRVVQVVLPVDQSTMPSDLIPVASLALTMSLIGIESRAVHLDAVKARVLQDLKLLQHIRPSPHMPIMTALRAAVLGFTWPKVAALPRVEAPIAAEPAAVEPTAAIAAPAATFTNERRESSDVPDIPPPEVRT